MKKFIFIVSIFIGLVSCKEEVIPQNKTPKKADGFQVIGTIHNFENKTVFLQEQNIDKTYNTLNQTSIKNNTFNFFGAIEYPKLLFLGFEGSNHKIPFIANNFDTFITIDITDLDKTVINGSQLQLDYNKYLTAHNVAKNKFVYQLNHIKSNANSMLSVIILNEMLGKTKWRLGQNRKAYNYLSSTIKETKLAQNINTFLLENEPLVEGEKEVAELSLNPEVENIIPKKAVFKEAIIEEKPIVKKPGEKKLPNRKKAPNFYAESQHGNDISLNQVRKGATVTLIDFWASWCGPCRSANPHLKRLYQKYHSKGFNIVSVSEDKYKDIQKWKNAIAEDGLPWQQVIDDNNRLANMFHVRGIPHTVLLDRNGGIISVKNSTYTIEQKLKAIFGF